MSERLQGWIECRNAHSLWFDDAWMPVVNIESILDDTEALREQPPFRDTLSDPPSPLRPGYGLPADVSALVAQEAGRWNVPYFCAFSTWAELLLLRSRADLPADWKLVFTIMESLAAYCGDDNVRIILWTHITDYG